MSSNDIKMQDMKENKPAESPAASLEHATDLDRPVYGDEAPIECPPHTTESKLITKIDFRVIPFLCVMYLLAFLGKISPLAH